MGVGTVDICRSIVLVPGLNARLVEKARNLAADLLVLDLEDSIPFADSQKQAARMAVVGALRAGGFAARQISVRVNGPATPWFADDVAAVLAAGAQALTLPHIHGVAEVLAAEDHIALHGAPAIHLAVETPGLLLALEEVAAKARFVVSLSVAPNDYCLETGATALLEALMSGRPGVAVEEHLVWLRAKLLAVAKARGWLAIDAPAIRDPDDMPGARAAIARSRGLGFDGVAVLQPRFLDLVNEVFTHSPAERAWAAGVVADFARMQAGLADARPVLRQHHELAQRVLRQAAAIGPGN